MSQSWWSMGGIPIFLLVAPTITYNIEAAVHSWLASSLTIWHTYWEMRWKLESSWRGVVMFKSFYSNLWASFKLTFFCCSFFRSGWFRFTWLVAFSAYSILNSSHPWYHVPKNRTSPTDLHIRMNYFWMWEVDGGNQKDTVIGIEWVIYWLSGWMLLDL